MDFLDPKFLEQLSGSGPIGVILILGTMVVLFLRGTLRRGRDVEEWHEVATKATDNLAAIVPTIESLAETVEAIYEADEAVRKEAELRSRIEAESKE